MWTDIGPLETAADRIFTQMVKLDAERQLHENNGAPLEAANKGHVIDELFEAWRFLCDKDPLPVDGPPRNSFAAWRDGALEVTFKAPAFIGART